MEIRFTCRALIVVLAIVGATVACDGGVVRTLDGKTYDGEVRIAASGLSITPPGKNVKPISVPLNDVLWARVREAEPPRPGHWSPEGLLPPPWESLSVGTPSPGRSQARFTSGAFSLKLAGGQMGAAHDGFLLVKQEIEGDGEVVARVRDIEDANRVWAGVTMRAGIEPDAVSVTLACVAGDLRLVRRTKPGQAPQVTGAGARIGPPVWLKLARRGGEVLALYSRDRYNWTPVVDKPVPLETATLYGMALCAPTRPDAAGAHFDEVHAAALASPGPPVAEKMRYGLLLRSGTMLVAPHMQGGDGGGLRFSKDHKPDTPLSVASIARIYLEDVEPQALARVPAGRRGALLRSGDFIEGEFKGMKDGRFLFSSVLFGPSVFDRGRDVLMIAANPVEEASPAIVVRCVDGSMYAGVSARLEQDKLFVRDAVAGEFMLFRDHIEWFTSGAAKFQPLEALPMTVAGPAVAPIAPPKGAGSRGGIVLSAGSSATWNLSRGYRVLTFRPGVPAGVLPTVPVYFSVSGDGKTLYRSRLRGSLDEAAVQTVPVEGVDRLTLKIEAAGLEIPIPAVFADAALAK